MHRLARAHRLPLAPGPCPPCRLTHSAQPSSSSVVLHEQHTRLHRSTTYTIRNDAYQVTASTPTLSLPERLIRPLIPRDFDQVVRADEGIPCLS